MRSANTLLLCIFVFLSVRVVDKDVAVDAVDTGSVHSNNNRVHKYNLRNCVSSVLADVSITGIVIDVA